MEQTLTTPSNNTRKYALAGAFFGLLFPILATLIRVLESRLPLNLSSMLAVQAADPLLWIIDTAPVFLCIFAILAGRRQDSLEQINNLLRVKEQELEAAQQSLETHIDERTHALETRGQLVDERTVQLSKATDVMRLLLSIQDLDRLLNSAAGIVSRQFGYEYAGIYLLDEQKQFAVLMASNKVDGAKTVQPGFHLRIGDPSLVDLAIRSGQPQFILEGNTGSQFKTQEGLTYKRSELVLPLRFGELIVGAVDLQSSEVKEFSEEYLSVLSILADFLAIAIQNVSLYEKTRRTINELEASTKQASAKEWLGWMESARIRGYRYDGIRAEPLKETAPSPSQDHALSIPLQLRGRLIGNLKIKSSDSSTLLTEDERAIAEATAERAAIALEGARLLDEAQKRAVRESFLSEMAARLSTSFQLDSILRDTVEELGQTLKASSVSFQLVNPSNLPPIEPADSDESTFDRKNSQ